MTVKKKSASSGEREKEAGKEFFLGIDIGGTKVLTAVLNRNYETIAVKKIKVNREIGAAAFVEQIGNTVSVLLEEAGVSLSHIRVAGVGCAGLIQVPEGVMQLCPNLPFLNDFPLKSELEDTLQVPVIVENDANAGLYGEYRLGAGKGMKNLAGIFLGTGIGGALILDGKLYRGASGFAGEIGHTVIHLPELQNEFGISLEKAAGRLAIATEAGELLLRQKAPHLLNQVGYDLKAIKSKALALAVTEGDTEVKKLLEKKAKILGIAVANVINFLSPEAVILGGGLMEALGNYFLPVVEETVKQYALKPQQPFTKIALAALEDYAVLKGAVVLAEDCLNLRYGSHS